MDSITKLNNFKKDFILIACAMQREAQLLIDKLDQPKKILEKGFIFFEGKLYTKNVIIGISGPGLINMSALISISNLKWNIYAIINYGMVGAYGNNIHKKDIVIGKECMNINSYITGKIEKGIDINSWEFVTFSDGKEDKLIIYDADKKLLDNCKKIKYTNYDVIFGRIGSGDIWDREFEKIILLKDKYEISCEDMESVAIYQLSNRFNIPCISIKGVSNNEILNESYDDSVFINLLDYVTTYIKELEI